MQKPPSQACKQKLAETLARLLPIAWSQTKPRVTIQKEEYQRSPIFILNKVRYRVNQSSLDRYNDRMAPAGKEDLQILCDDARDYAPYFRGNTEPVSDEILLAEGIYETDHEPHSVWFTRAEAERHAGKIQHHFKKGYYIHAISAGGLLHHLLKFPERVIEMGVTPADPLPTCPKCGDRWHENDFTDDYCPRCKIHRGRQEGSA
jgi:hypothetical protein